MAETKQEGTALRVQDLVARYDVNEQEVLLSGSQALVRVLLAQRELDKRAGLNTGGYVSGYRGSPLGGLDMGLWKAAKQLEACGIVFQPGLNEELAASAVGGTQQLDAYGPARVEGVFGMWYGKGPGVDRAGDALKHANVAGTHPRGGVLAVFGDDHPGKSSTVAHHSEQAMAANAIPVLYPSNVQDIARFGLLGYAMSRYSGSWVAMKLVNETAEQTAVVNLAVDEFRPELPATEGLLPPEGVHFRGVYAPLRDEEIVNQHRLPLVARFARANCLDSIALGAEGPLGIVTAGKAYEDVRQALRMLGIDDARARALGLAVYKVGLVWPLEPVGLRAFASRRQELFFVEEKAAFMEPQAAALLYNQVERPAITGKSDVECRPLLPSEKSLEPVDIAFTLAARLEALGLADAELAERVRGLRSYRSALLPVLAVSERRMPYFCSGCPHNTSTKLPEGSHAIAGIGCHGMAMWAKPGTHLSAQMGGEGLNWAGLHAFSNTRHVFQNLGDGTYFHSGSLAIRAAVASGANITYKILFNDAVAMTGGQPIDGQLSVVQLAHQVLAEGASRVVVLTEDPLRYAKPNSLPPGVDLFERGMLDRVQKELRDHRGCTVLIYDQTCAAEKRRRRKKGAYPDPDQRMFIHPDVCEGCGDCSAKSGCVSIEPLQTPLGRKRAINQSSCNKDYSCVQGFCPSFVTVRGARQRRAPQFDIPAATLRRLPPAPIAVIPENNYSVLMAGIGGTGVVTVSAVLAMAAHLEYKAASTYDMTGLSQKNGAVFSHLRVAAHPQDIHSPRVGQGEASLVMGFDLVAALSDESFRTIGRGTAFIGNRRVQETAAFVADRDARIDGDVLVRKIAQRVDDTQTGLVDAAGLAQALFGDAVAVNMLLLGVAAQRGWLPVGTAAIERAIELNGVQVDLNKRAFLTGRVWVFDPTCLAAAAAPTPLEAARLPLDELVAQRSALLEDYQNATYADRYRRLVQRVGDAEQAALPGSNTLARAVAENFSKLMAYKDEYEVARLYSRPQFMKMLHAEFEGDLRVSFNLSPPLFAGRDPGTGLPRKREYGGWMLRMMAVLARLKGLRGTRLDLFGYMAERRAERALVAEYEETLTRIAGQLRPDNHAQAVALASLPQDVRGFGHVKQAAMATAAARRSALLAEFDAAQLASYTGSSIRV
ncbi:MAG TPA: indolepyruvate ferredoxin oxidoreductase family protein [Burkholderiaceae bacterium]|nr:indolepyruvate ferredoxin oxidoreductase family protein [Burkholderiaceae bacterium]